MESGGLPYTGRGDPASMSQQMVTLFAQRGWLNQDLRITYQDKRYRISCTPDLFYAYRINEDWGIGPGAPGWPVCIITKNYVFDESHVSEPPTARLTSQDWLNILSNSSFELV